MEADTERRLFIATVTLDHGFDAALHWRIDPDLDAPCDLLVAALEAASRMAAVRRLPLPRHAVHGPGEGTAWITHGRAVLIELR